MMTDPAVVGDIGDSTSRFGLVKQGSMAIQHLRPSERQFSFA